MFPEEMSATNLGWCWEKSNLTKKNWLKTFSGYTIFWYTQNLLSSILLPTQTSICCVVFLQKKLKRGDIIVTGEKGDYQTFRNLQFSQLFFFSHRNILTWEIRAMKKLPVYLSVSLVLFWALGNLQKSHLTKQTLQHGCSNTGRESVL